MRFSIITVNYNDAVGFQKTIDSVTSQTFSDYEHIIVDGGSSDGSTEIIKNNANRFSYWQSQSDEGIYDAMNIGVEHAHGEYLNFMNSGDVFHSPHTLKSIDVQLDNVDIVSGNSFMPEINKFYINPYKELTLLTLLKHPLSHQSIFYKKDIFNHHCFDTNLKMMADFKLNLESIVLDNCSIKIVNDVVSDFDVNGISSENPELYKKELSQILSECFPYRVIADYEKMYTPEEIPLVELLPQLRHTRRVQVLLYQIAKFLLKITK